LNALDQQKIKKQNKPRKVNYLHINKAVLFASPATKCKRKIIENKIECSLPFFFLNCTFTLLPGHIRRLYFPVLNICISEESVLYQETGKSLIISGKWEKAFHFGKKIFVHIKV